VSGELAEAGYSPEEIEKIKTEVDHYAKVRDEVKLASGDYIDLKAYEPAMRYLIDQYIRAEDSEKISACIETSFVSVGVRRRPSYRSAVRRLPAAGRRGVPYSAATSVWRSIGRMRLILRRSVGECSARQRS